MAGHKSFNVLRDRMPADSRPLIDAKVRELKAEMLLSELRKLSEMTQVEVAKALGISQPEVSRLEGEEDMQISTLARLVSALGGELEISVKLPGGKVKLAQFSAA